MLNKQQLAGCTAAAVPFPCSPEVILNVTISIIEYAILLNISSMAHSFYVLSPFVLHADKSEVTLQTKRKAKECLLRIVE